MAQLVPEPAHCVHDAGLTGGRHMWDGKSGQLRGEYHYFLKGCSGTLLLLHLAHACRVCLVAANRSLNISPG